MPGKRHITRVNQLSDTDAAYIAGFLDGEGSLLWYTLKGRKYPVVCIYNNVLPVLEWITEKVGCGHIYARKPDAAHHAIRYKWTLHSEIDVSTLVRQLKPYLKIKNLDS